MAELTLDGDVQLAFAPSGYPPWRLACATMNQFMSDTAAR
jgi:hypothetical protein